MILFTNIFVSPPKMAPPFWGGSKISYSETLFHLQYGFSEATNDWFQIAKNGQGQRRPGESWTHGRQDMIFGPWFFITLGGEIGWFPPILEVTYKNNTWIATTLSPIRCMVNLPDLPQTSTKCRQICHTWILWVIVYGWYVKLLVNEQRNKYME